MSAISTVDAEALQPAVAYHEATKHHYHRYARSLGYMDWANQPNPFRRYQGAVEIPLELKRLARSIPFDRMYEPNTVASAPVCLDTLSDFLHDSLALSAWKQSGTNRWALRVNPSSGNLHPTEAYLLVESLNGEGADPSLYHYVSESHSLERRASFSHQIRLSLMSCLPAGSFLVGLSSIIWREAWKYGERAFRYCQHDIGHAVAALRFSAALCGWQLALVSNWSTDDMALLLGLDRQKDFIDEEHEEVELLAVVAPNSATVASSVLPRLDDDLRKAIHSAAWYGHANRLSREHVPWEVIETATRATRMPRGGDSAVVTTGSCDGPGWSVSTCDVDAREVIHNRRSCVALDGKSTISRDRFLRLLAGTLPGSHPPWDALYWPTSIHFVLFVHRVDGVTAGLYMFVRDRLKLDALKAATRKDFLWQTPRDIPDRFPLYRLLESDCRDAARALSCHQDIAADGFFSLGMIAEFAEPLNRHGGWFYRNLFWEAGVIGQVLYLEATAAGIGSTGIGCYFDDPVHDVLGLSDNQFQSLYHFTVGVPVDDPRLQSFPPYDTASE